MNTHMNTNSPPDVMHRVLVVDDDEIFRGYVGTLLEMEGYSVLQDHNGFKALDVLKTETVDLVVTDIIMPGMEGLETIMHLQKDNGNLPIVAMSGFPGMDGQEYLDHARQFGAKATFAKPFDSREFLDTITELVNA